MTIQSDEKEQIWYVIGLLEGTRGSVDQSAEHKQRGMDIALATLKWLVRKDGRTRAFRCFCGSTDPGHSPHLGMWGETQ